MVKPILGVNCIICVMKKRNYTSWLHASYEDTFYSSRIACMPPAVANHRLVIMNSMIL